MLPFLAAAKPAILALHLLGLALGIGGATINDFLFFSFLRDREISPKEAEVLRALSKVIMLGLVLLCVSGIGLYVPEMERLNASPAFLSKVIIVGVIALNGILMHLILVPRLIDLSFTHNGIPAAHNGLRALAFALGAVSFMSWYATLIIATLKRTFPAGTTMTHILGIYGAVLFIAIIVSQVLRARMSRPLPPI